MPEKKKKMPPMYKMDTIRVISDKKEQSKPTSKKNTDKKTGRKK